jgi:hypothetical protein
VGFALGITHKVGVPLFLVILPLKSRGKAFYFGVFHAPNVLGGRGMRFAIPPFSREFWGLKFELEINHEVFQPSQKFLMNPWSESRDRWI